jgi:signal peptidase II
MPGITPVIEEERSPSRGRPWLPDVYLAVLIVSVFALDQLTKGWVRDNLIIGASRPRDGFFRITHTYNTGSAFGLFPDQSTLLMIASVVAIGVLVMFYRSNGLPGPWVRLSMGLILGGATGNLADRITLGHVTDFIDVGPWPVFNLADSSIMVGLAFMAWFLLFFPPKERPTAHPELRQESRVLLGPVEGHERDAISDKYEAAATTSDAGQPDSPQLQEDAQEG